MKPLYRPPSEKEKEHFLSEAEVVILPPGTAVTVFWSGGNGPCQYTIQKDGALTTIRFQHPHVDFHKDWPVVDSFIGFERFHTRVILTEHEDKE